MAITIQQLACAKYLKDFHQFACHIDTGNWIVGNTHDPTNRIKHWGKLPKDSFIGYGKWDYHDIKEKDIFDAFWRLVWIIEYKSQERFFCSIQDAFERLLNSVVLKEKSCSSTDLIEGLGRYELFCKAIMECFGIIDNLNNKESSTAFEREKLAYKNNRFANGAKHDYLDKFVKFNHQSHIANIRSIRNELIHNDQSSFADHKHIHAFLREELLALVLFTFDLTHGADHTLDEGFLRHEDNKKNSQNVRVNVQIRSDRHSDWEQIAVFYDREGTFPVLQIDQNASTAKYSFDAEYFKEYFIGAKRLGESCWNIVEDKPFVPTETAIGELRIEVFPSRVNEADIDFDVQLKNYQNVQFDNAAVTHEELKKLQENLDKVVDESIKAEIGPIKDQLNTLYNNLQKQEASIEQSQELAHDLEQTKLQVDELNQAFDQYRKDTDAKIENATEQFKTKLQASNKSLDELNQTVLSHDIRIKELEEQLEEEKVKLRNLGITIEDLREYVKYIATEQGEKIDNLKDYVDKVKKETSKINSVLKVFACVGATLIAGGATVVACNRLLCYKVAEWWLSNNLAVGGAAVILLTFLALSLFTLCKLKNIHWGWKTLPIIAVIAMGTIVCRMPAYTIEGLHNRMVDEHATFDEGLYLMAHNLGDNDAAYWCAERIEKNLLEEVNNAGSDSSLSVMANSDLPAKACKYYKLAKERYESILAGGSIDATMAYRLAMMYLTGKGGECDRGKATRYASQAQSHPMGAALYAYCCYKVGDMQEMRSQMKLIEAGQVGNKEDILYKLLKVLDEIDEIRNTDMTGKDITVLKQKASDCFDKICEWESITGRNPFLSVELINLVGVGIQTADGQALVPRSFSRRYNLLIDRSITYNLPTLQYDTGNMLLKFNLHETAKKYFLTAWHNGFWDAAVKLVEMADNLYPDGKKPEWYEDAHSVLEAHWTGEVSSCVWKAITFFMSAEISEAEHQLDKAIELTESQSKYVYTPRNWWLSIATACLNTNNFQRAYEIAMKELVDSTVNHGFKYYLLANQYAKGYGVEKDIHKADSLLRIAVDSACHEAKITNMCLKQRKGVTLEAEETIDRRTGKLLSYSSYSLPGDIEELGKTDDRAKDIQLLYYRGRTLRGDELVDDFNYYHNIPTYEYMEGITQSDYERIAGPAYDRDRPVYAHVLCKSKSTKAGKFLILLSEITKLLDDNVAANIYELSRATIYNLADMIIIWAEMMNLSNTWSINGELFVFNLLETVVHADAEIGLWTAKCIYNNVDNNVDKAYANKIKQKLLKSYPQLMKAKEPSEKEIFMPDPWLL